MAFISDSMPLMFSCIQRSRKSQCARTLTLTVAARCGSGNHQSSGRKARSRKAGTAP